MNLTGKVAIVTGAAAGLGLGFTRAFLTKGCKVCLVDVNETKGLEEERSLRDEFGVEMVLFVKCDVTNEQDLKRAFDAAEGDLGVVEIVVNNAGMLGELTPGRLVDTNFTGVCHGTNLAIERMRKDKGGRGGVVVNVSSITGLYPIWFMPVYAATKTAIYSYTRSWSVNPDVPAMGIRFNILCPSATSTGLLSVSGKVLSESEFHAFVDSQGLLEVQDVAAALCRHVEQGKNGDALLMSKKGGTRLVNLVVADL